MKRKYELTDKIIWWGYKVYRIRALRSFGDVKAGDLGGLIACEKNLSHIGGCWIYDNALISGNANISGNARVYGNVLILENARIGGNARIGEDTQVFIYGDAQVYGDAYVYGLSHTMHLRGHMRLDRGVWNQTIEIGGILYIVSSTLEKVLVG